MLPSVSVKNENVRVTYQQTSDKYIIFLIKMFFYNLWNLSGVWEPIGIDEIQSSWLA